MSNVQELSPFRRMLAVDVTAHVEKKNGLSYLSWAWAVAELQKADPAAFWTYGEPVRWGDSVMVFCTVTAFGKALTAQLPVMDHRNKAIANPDSFAVNTAMQRCLAKGIALHGLGLSLYAGEDIPAEDVPEPTVEQIQQAIDTLTAAAKKGTGAFKEAVDSIPAEVKDKIDPQIKRSIANIAKQHDKVAA